MDVCDPRRWPSGMLHVVAVRPRVHAAVFDLDLYRAIRDMRIPHDRAYGSVGQLGIGICVTCG